MLRKMRLKSWLMNISIVSNIVFYTFIKNKKIEWDLYRTQVTDYELKRYLPIL